MDNVLLNISERYESLKIISDNIENATLSSIRYLHNNRTATVNIDGAAAYFTTELPSPTLARAFEAGIGVYSLSSSKGTAYMTLFLSGILKRLQYMTLIMNGTFLQISGTEKLNLT